MFKKILILFSLVVLYLVLSVSPLVWASFEYAQLLWVDHFNYVLDEAVVNHSAWTGSAGIILYPDGYNGNKIAKSQGTGALTIEKDITADDIDIHALLDINESVIFRSYGYSNSGSYTNNWIGNSNLLPSEKPLLGVAGVDGADSVYASTIRKDVDDCSSLGGGLGNTSFPSTYYWGDFTDIQKFGDWIELDIVFRRPLNEQCYNTYVAYDLVLRNTSTGQSYSYTHDFYFPLQIDSEHYDGIERELGMTIAPGQLLDTIGYTANGLDRYASNFKILTNQSFEQDPHLYFPEPGSAIDMGSFSISNIIPRGRFQVPTNYEYTQNFTLTWKPWAQLSHAWRIVDKVKFQYADVLTSPDPPVEFGFDFDKLNHSGDSVNQLLPQSYAFDIDLDAEGIDEGTYWVAMSFYDCPAWSWYGDCEWTDYKSIGIFSVPDALGEYMPIPDIVPDDPIDHYYDDPGILIRYFNSIKYNFPFGYFFLTRDLILSAFDVSAESSPTAMASFNHEGRSYEFPLLDLEATTTMFPSFVDSLKTMISVYLYALFVVHVYDRITEYRSPKQLELNI